MTERDLRDAIVGHARSLFDRGLSPDPSGNISARTDDGFLMTPTGSSFGALDPTRISRLDAEGRHMDGDPPTKARSTSRCTSNVQTRAQSCTCTRRTPSLLPTRLLSAGELARLRPST